MPTADPILQKEPYEIEKVLVLNRNHIPLATWKWLLGEDAGRELFVHVESDTFQDRNTPNSVMVGVPCWDAERGSEEMKYRLRNAPISADLVELLIRARHLNCRHIRFDVDGQIAKHLAVFDWGGMEA